jgi:hypothetical protein
MNEAIIFLQNDKEKFEIIGKLANFFLFNTSEFVLQDFTSYKNCPPPPPFEFAGLLQGRLKTNLASHT